MDAFYGKNLFLELFTQHQQDLIRYATSIVGERPLAEDVVQDAYIRLSKSKEGWYLNRPTEEPIGYIYKTIRNMSIDLYRKRSKEDVGNAEEELQESQKPFFQSGSITPESEVIARQDLRILQNALDELPERTRKAFELCRFNGMKLADIALELDVSVGTAHNLVKTALDHCTSRLKNNMKN
ncbi:RNA polymerase sigma factor [Curvivirga aplysinae]|uniref:RNA polymerase sigma factor n=1 Tax=Curvivirga aplysinae TaxID=2529852 RepID=UPI0012BCBAC7|nr:sigma-70 family RNA polymerase sigma factor [Curvivirga aplysinae]MTI08721.1 sigma-70 family RNA polymerase sigma factor [Curvivirga aplysinae]